MKNVIVRPVITEKSLADVKQKKYTFIVANYATKTDIKSAVHSFFKVDVENVYTQIVKTVSNRTSRKGKKTKEGSYKKARVLIKKDQKIDIFETDQ